MLPAQAQSTTAVTTTTARVIVRFKVDAEVTTAGSGRVQAASAATPDRQLYRASWLAGRHGLNLADGRVISTRHQVVQATGMSSAQLAAVLAQDPAVSWAVPDRVRKPMAYPQTAPNDPLYPENIANSVRAGQWYLRSPTTTFVSAINALSAWPKATGSGVVVADLDTGVRFDHPDLADQFFASGSSAYKYGYDFISTASDNRDGDGVDADASDPGDWSTASQCEAGEAAQDSSWHGTQTSSVMAAKTNNGVGMAGVSPDVKLLPLRVLGSCGGFDSDIAAAMRWAAGLSVPNVPANIHPAKVINLSLGAPGSCDSLYPDLIDELTQIGVVVVASVGNEAGKPVSSPANCEGVVAVAGLRHSGTKVGFSNIGPEVTVSAPAGNCVTTSGSCLYPILTATNAGTRSASSHTYTNSNDPAVGTSFAAPMVSSVVAMMFEVNPTLTVPQVRSLLRSSARAFPTTTGSAGIAQCRDPAAVNNIEQDECYCTTGTCGAGMLDAAAAVAAASPTAVPTAVVTASSTALQVGATLVLSGSSSAAPTGRVISSKLWTVTGGHTAIVGSATADTVTVQGSSVGLDKVTLTVTDNYGAQRTREFWVAVNPVVTPANAAPVPRIVLSQSSLTGGDSLVADGATSAADTNTANDPDTISYSWSLADASAPAALSGATTGSSIQLVADSVRAGNVPIVLTVGNGTHSASLVSNVMVTAVVPSAALNASATSVLVNQQVTLDASLSAATAGRTIASYAWSIVSGAEHASLQGDTTAASLQLRTTALGKVRVQVVVTDSQGATDTRTIDIFVVSPEGTSTSSGPNGVNVSGGGGGGAVDGLGLLGLLGLLVLPGLAGRRRGERSPTLS